MTTALFIGRFQPFHNGHLKVVKDLSREYDKVIIGIGSAQVKYSPKNPWTLEEREEMMQTVFDNENLDNIEFLPIPDIEEDKDWVEFITSKIEFDDLYTGNEWTASLFEQEGHSVVRLQRYDNLKATELREMLEKHESIKEFVPKAVFDEISPN